MDKEKLLCHLTKQEASIPWLYRDGGGEITTGIGHALPTPEQAVRLAWHWPATGRPATPIEVRLAFADVYAAPAGKPANFYASLADIRLSIEEIHRVALLDIDLVLDGLNRKLPWFASLPEPAETAICDMAFNLGIYGLIRDFPHMLAALQEKDWNTAAQQCHRQGIGEDRNRTTAQLFLSCREDG